jgi:flagellum-specific peptidoglycan hydrolase FlgJ
MDKQTFVKTYYPIAKDASKWLQDTHGLHLDPICYLTRCAIETGWGKVVKHNNFFGIKRNNGIGKSVLITTTEWHTTKNVKYPKILSITWNAVKKLFMYKVQDTFIAYDTTLDSFKDFGDFLRRNPRYSSVFDKDIDSLTQTSRVALNGFATAPNSLKLSRQVHVSIENEIKKLGLK